MKNRGFTMVELLGVIVVLGILSMIAIGAVSRYRYQAAEQAFKTLSESSANAAENYYMDNLAAADTVSLEELVEDDYLENLNDPWGDNKNCTGQVTRELSDENKKKDDSIDLYKFKVELKCSRKCKCTIYPKSNEACTCSIS